jgi:hypothetical protein
VPQKNDGIASSCVRKSSTIVQKYKVVQLFPEFIASIPNTFAETINLPALLLCAGGFVR